MCLNFGERPDTPPELKKWRTTMEPGAHVRHPGVVRGARGAVTACVAAAPPLNTCVAHACTHARAGVVCARVQRDDPVDPTRLYGKFPEPSAHVSDVVAHGAQTKLAQYVEARGEAIYASVKREPLGKPLSRGVVLPAAMTAPDYRFGVTTATDVSTKELLYPSVSHVPGRARSEFAPGEQRTRGYTDLPVDMSTHRFGKCAPRGDRAGGVALALNPAKALDAVPPSVVPKAVADFRHVHTDHLGAGEGRGGAARARACACVFVCACCV